MCSLLYPAVQIDLTEYTQSSSGVDASSGQIFVFLILGLVFLMRDLYARVTKRGR